MCHVLPDIVTDKVARRKSSNSACAYSQPPLKFQMDSHLESQLWEVTVEPRVFEGIAGGSGTTNLHC